MDDVRLYHTDDWSALFIDGHLVFEGHEVRLHELRAFCPNVKVGDIREEWLDSPPLWKYLSEHGRFPSSESSLREYL